MVGTIRKDGNLNLTLVLLVLLLYKIPFWGMVDYLYIDFLVLLNVYFAINYFENYTVLSSFFLGLFFDLANENILGTSALKYSILTYFLQSNINLFRVRNTWQQLIYLFALLNIVCISEYMVFVRLNFMQSAYNLFFYILTTCAFWPVFTIILDKLSFRFLAGSKL